VATKFMKGAMTLSISLFIVRLIGLLYLVPFQSLVGVGGFALYGYAYVPYSILVTLSGLGIPGGISKFVAKYNALGEYQTSRRVFRISMAFMLIFGMITFTVMYASAPLFARMVINSDDMYNSVADVTTAIRMISFAVIIVPPMSILRGFFQGNQDMKPTAISQLVEQLARISLIIGGSFVVIHLLEGSVQTAVNVSVFAAVIAAIGALLVLYRSWVKKKPDFDALLATSVPTKRRRVDLLFKELLSYALPFAVLSLIASLFQLIDLATFNSLMISAGTDPRLTEAINGIYITGLFKIVMIPVSFAIAFGQPLMPAVTAKIQANDLKGARTTLASAITLTSFITIPAVMGMWFLANPIFIMLFNQGSELNQIGGSIFATGSFIAIFMALNAILDATMQGIAKHYTALKILAGALVIKLVGNLVLIPRFGVNGAILATILAYAVCIVLKFLQVRKTTGIETRKIVRRHLAILVFTALMLLVIWPATLVLNRFIDYEISRFYATLYVLAIGAIGVIVYGGLAIYFDLAKVLFGDKLSFNQISARFTKKTRRSQK